MPEFLYTWDPISKCRVPVSPNGNGGSSGVGVRPQIASKVRVDTLSPTLYAWIDEANPTTNKNNVHPISLKATAGSRNRGIVKFDHSAHAGKTIAKAYVQLLNAGDQPNNATRTVTVQRIIQTVTTGVTWNTYNGTNAWNTAGGLGLDSDVSSATFSQTVFRPAAWADSWLIDITSLYASWCSGTNPNNGLMLSCSGDLTVFSSSTLYPRYDARLIIVWADGAETNGLIPDEEKLALAMTMLLRRRWGGGFTWTSAGSKNAAAIAIKQGWYDQYLSKLLSYLDLNISSSGTLNVAMTSYYHGPPFGEAIILAHQQSGLAKYKTALDTMKDFVMALPLAANGLMKDDQKTETELVYCAMVFLAAYADAYGDPDRALADVVLDQTIRMYDVLTAGSTTGIPYHMQSYYVSSKGLIGLGWSRGVGWLFGGMSKLLRHNSVKNHPRFQELLSRYKALAQVVVAYQTPGGLWRGTIHESDKPEETSGTCLIGMGLEYGVQLGYLDESYRKFVDKAAQGLLRYSTTGLEMAGAFTTNQDLNYNLTTYERSDFSFGLWMEFHMVTMQR